MQHQAPALLRTPKKRWLAIIPLKHKVMLGGAEEDAKGTAHL